MHQRKLTSLTVVSPFYNEAGNVRVFYETLTEVLDSLNVSYDLVFVDDGSRDETLRILNELAVTDPRLTVLSFARNFGHQIALTAGLDYALGEAVIVMDSDLQHPPAFIPSLIEAYEQGADVVYAVRNKTPHLSLRKRITTDGFYFLLKRFGSVEVIPGAADFRLMSQPVVSELRQMRETHRYMRGMVPWLGFSKAVTYFDQGDRHSGTPGYTFRKSLKLARHGLFSFSTIPLELITWLGILLTGLAFTYLVYILLVAIFGQPVPGWSSVIVVSLTLGGVQLISIGVLAQYIGMIFEQVKGRPLYVLKQKHLSETAKISPPVAAHDLH